MTVLQVCAFAAPNAGNFIASLTHLEEKLAQKGIKTIYAFSDGAENKPWCREIQKRTMVYFLPTAKARILPRTYRIFRRIYRENDVSIVHSHFELYDIPATVTAPKNIRVFWHLHDALKTHYLSADFPRRLLMRLQYCSAWKRPKVLSVSKEHAEFVRILGFNASNISYLPNGINTARIQPATIKTDNLHFLMFGWEVIRKGVDLVIEAARALPSGCCQIRIVGQTECREYIEAHADIPCVYYQSPVDDINILYQDTYAFLHVSRSEGLSYALLEVIYAGIPVICSDIPENQFAKVFRNVFFVRNQSAEEIHEMIRRLINKLVMPLQEDVAYNRAIIEREYSVEAWSKKLTTIYLE